MGNKLGWALAGILTIGLLAVIILKMTVPSPSDFSPEIRQAGLMDPAVVSVPLVDVLGWEPSESGNAGDDYARAVALMKANQAELREAVRKLDEIRNGTFTPSQLVSGTLKKIDAFVAAGAKKKTMRYAFVHTPKKLQVDFFQPFIDELCSHRQEPEPLSLSLSLEMLGGMYLARKDYPAAEKIFRHELVLGRHMLAERSLAGMGVMGIYVQNRALQELASLYDSDALNSPRRLKDVQRYYDALDVVQKVYDTKWKLLWNTSPKPGDVFYVIGHDRDRAWRAQGLLALGIIRFTRKNHRGDMRETANLLDKFAAGEDPIEAAAAKASMNLTVDEFRMLGSRF